MNRSRFERDTMSSNEGQNQMNAAQFKTADVLRGFLTLVSGHPLLERLFFASVELAVLAVLVYAAIRVGRIRSARLASILWLLVLAKPLVSLAIGSPIPLVRMHVPEVAVVVPAPKPKLEQVAPQPSVETPKPDDSQPFTDDMGQAVLEPETRPQVPAEMPPAPTTLEPTTPEPIVAETPPVQGPQPGPVRSNVPIFLLAVWLCGVALFALRSLIDRIRVRRLVRGGRVPDANLAARYHSVASQLRLSRPVPLRVTSQLEGPALVGSIFPTVLIPDWLADDAQQNSNHTRLDWALRHELMHWKLRDPLASLVRELAQILFYFHPAAWWAGKQWEAAAEKACDRAIVTTAADSLDYAEQLYAMLVGMQGRLRARIGNGLFATRTQIGQRIAALLNGPRTPHPHLSALALVGVTLAAAVTLSIGGAFADKNAKREESEKTPLVAAADHPAEPQPAPVSAPTTSKPEPAPAPVPDVTFTYAGTVVDDRGKPVAGAKISLDYLHASDPREPVPTLAVSDSKGRFEFSRRKRDFADAGLWGPWWFPAMIVATKPGYGPAGGQSIEFETTGRLVAEQHHPPGWRPKGWSNVLKLASDDVPIHGRILDTEGRPVSGALVQAINLWEGRDGSLDTWEAAALRPEPDLRRLEQKLRQINYANGLTAPRPAFVPAVRTDASGSFTLKGLGRERLADLAVSAAGIETTPLHVRTRRGAVIKVPLDDRNRKFGEETFYPSDFTRVAGPSVPVEGQVTDARSQRPLAGIGVNAARVPSSPFFDSLAARLVSATTDARGHYRLEGLPLGFARLGVVPPPGSRYLMAGVDVTTRMRPSPLVADIKLAGGVMVRGRATDSRTGMPAEGSLQYFAFWTNPHLQEAPGFEISGFVAFRSILHYRCDADGRFEIPVLPGPGILTFRADALAQLPTGIGAAGIDGPKRRGDFSTAPYPCRADGYHLLTPLNPQPGTDSLALDLTIRSPAIVTGTVRAPDGKPLGDYTLFEERSFLGEEGRWRHQSDATFETKVYSPNDHYRLMFYQPLRNLVGFYEFTGEPAGKLEVKLQPGATIKGRVVDDAGRPLESVSLVVASQKRVVSDNGAIDARDAANRQVARVQITSDKEGRFELRGVVPGLEYSAEAIGAIKDSRNRKQPPGAIFTNVTADAGQTKELGDLRIASSNSNAAAKRPKAIEDNANVVRGRVLLPDGRSASDAKVSLVRFHWKSGDKVWWEPLGSTTPNERGEFEFAAPKVLMSTYERDLILATAGGFGSQWAWCLDGGKPSKPIELKLRRDVPIRGRILDLEGKPVARAKISVVTITDSRNGDLGPWLAAMKSGVHRYSVGANAMLGKFIRRFPGDGGSAATDVDGRFALSGLGAERLVDLSVESDATAYTQVTVATRQMESIIRPNLPNNAGGLEIFAAEFTKSVSPTRPIVGTVRDAKTGEPLAGVSVESWRLSGESMGGQRGLRTTSDAQGRYRLNGMPKGKGNEIFVVPNDDQPYFMRELKVPDTPGIEPVTVDIELDRGLWITGRVTDKETGKPVFSRINYWPFLTNPFTRGRPEFGPGYNMQGDYFRYATRPDGSFRVPGLPGRGLVGASAMAGNYREGAGASEIGGFDEDGRLPTYRNQGWPGIRYPTTMKAINPAEGTETVACDLVCDHGETVRLTVLDSEGKPVRNCSISQPAKNGKIDGHNSPFEVSNLPLNIEQPLLIEQRERKLARFLVFTLKEDSPRSMTVKLEPCAKVVGRLVDEEGLPLKGITIQPSMPGGHDFWPTFRTVLCQPDGRFEYPDLPSGVKVDFSPEGTEVEFIQSFGRMTASPGQTIDLGDIKLKRRKFTAPISTTRGSEPTAKPQVADANLVHGRVLLPDGRPAAGARVMALRQFWTAPAKRSPLGRAVAGRDGQFTISIPKKQPYDGTGSPGGVAWIAAVADGFGAQCKVWNSTSQKSKEVVLNLVPELPIHGRIVDLEGRPVRSVAVQVELQEAPRAGMDLWLQAAKSGKRSEMFLLRRGMEIPGYEDESQRQPVTDADGRFTLTGVGADRVVRLGLHGETIAYAELDVVTRAIPRMPRRDPLGASGELYGSDFTYQAAPTQPVVGTVCDASSGAPLAGVIIESRSIAGVRQALSGILRTVTDAQGKYRLVGLPKGNGSDSDQVNVIGVLPNEDQSYFMLNSVNVPETAGLGPVRLDFKLTRGVWITGHVTDKATGKAAVPTRLAYIPSQTNSLASRIPEFKRKSFSIWDLDRTLARRDGTYRLVGLQGRGLVAAWAVNRSYRVGAGASEIAGMTRDGKYPSFWGFDSAGANAVKEINPTPGTTEITCDLAFDPGGTLHVSIVDETGKPAGLCFYSSNPHAGAVDSGRAENSTLELSGLGRNESRPLLIFQLGRRFGKVLLARNDDKVARGLTVKLEPCATIKGRLLDADGNAIEAVRLSAAAYGQDYWLPAGQCATGRDGRFVLDNLPPGAESYWVNKDDDREVEFTKIAEKLRVIAGQTIDLGDIKLKRKKPAVTLANPRSDREASKTAKNDAPDANVVHGRVLLPDGKPAAGAKVLALRRFYTARVKRSPLAKTVAGANGEFTLRCPDIRFADAISTGSVGVQAIAAEAKGFGSQSTEWRSGNDNAKELVLKLLPELPIHGRIVDLEGKPVGGVRVKLAWQNTIDTPFGPWLEEKKSERTAPYRPVRPRLEMPAYDDDTEPPIVTDQEGRFTLTGVGADRVVGLELRGETIAYSELDVIAHATPPILRRTSFDSPVRLFGADFTFQAAPTTPVVGTVRDAASGAPLAGVAIESRHLAGLPRAAEGAVRAVTDAEGKYRLIGIPKGKGSGLENENTIAVAPNDNQPYFMLHRVQVPDTPLSWTTRPSARTSKGFLICGTRVASSRRQFNQTISRILRFSA
jgi:beta-lactamase regulating signal transducer with metallopeptidase domain/protocatechuate 3,4-dioxygenase beta subunit